MHITHPQLVAALVKPPTQIKADLTAQDCHLVHMILGISGEAGELLDALKKKVIYRKHIDLQNVIEELGDLEFYLEGLRQSLNITREECLYANIEKLKERYKSLTYSNEAAQKREDKQKEVPPIVHVVDCNNSTVPVPQVGNVLSYGVVGPDLLAVEVLDINGNKIVVALTNKQWLSTRR